MSIANRQNTKFLEIIKYPYGYPLVLYLSILTWITTFPINIFSSTDINFQLVGLFGSHAFFTIPLVCFVLKDDISIRVEYRELIRFFRLLLQLRFLWWSVWPLPWPSIRYWISVSTNSILEFYFIPGKIKEVLTWLHQSKAYSQSLRHNVSHHMPVSLYGLDFHQFVQQWVDINKILVLVFSFLLFGPWEYNLVNCHLQFHPHKMLQKDLNFSIKETFPL